MDSYNEGGKEIVMFELNLYQRVLIQAERRSGNPHAHRYITAIDLFKSSLFKGRCIRIVKRVLSQPWRLYDLHSLREQIKFLGGSYSGIRTVSIGRIIGSEGRTADFDADFHPFSECVRERWINIALLYLSCTSLPPVVLVQVGGVYFVRDGHHRISVARAFGQKEVDAEVTVWKASPPFPWEARSMPRPVHMTS